MELKEELKQALTELRKEKERKFDQTVELIVNLQKFDVKRDSLNAVITVPHKIKDKKIAAFLEVRNGKVETITPDQFRNYSNKKVLKHLVKKFDFFISQASVMPKVATVFGKVLGPAGKMPSPQLGIIANTDDKTIEELKDKVNRSLKIKSKEPSIKLAVGKQKMKDEEIIDNVIAVYNSLIKILPKQKENIKSLGIKFTMTKLKRLESR